MAKAKNKTPLQEARTENASYAGLLARWGDMTGNIPPHDVNRQKWLKDKFREHLDILNNKKRVK